MDECKYKAFMIMPYKTKMRYTFYESMQDICKSCSIDLKIDKQYPKKSTDFKNYSERINNADIVIVDLSEYNPNCYYELGITHQIDFNKVIHIIEDKYFNKRPTDIHNIGCIQYAQDNIDKFKEEFTEELQVKLNSDEFKTIKIGISPYPEMELINIASKKGMFSKVKVKTNYFEWNKIVDALLRDSIDLIITNIEMIDKKEKANYRTDFVVLSPIFEYKNFAILARNNDKIRTFRQLQIEASCNGGYNHKDIVMKTLKQLSEVQMLASFNTDHYDMLKNLNIILGDNILNFKNITGSDPPLILLKRFLNKAENYDAFVGGIPERIICRRNKDPEIIEVITFQDIYNIFIDTPFALTQVNAFVTTLEKYESIAFRRTLKDFSDDMDKVCSLFNKSRPGDKDRIIDEMITNFNTQLQRQHCDYSITSEEFHRMIDDGAMQVI